tara:strand:+ start:676 stop:951 length:276 start_codon:yes stop_codon:yes gene_type:complete
MFYNQYTGNAYQGKNIEILEKTGKTGGFCTFNQAIKLGYSIPKGTKAIAKLIKPMIDLVEQPDGRLDERQSGRMFSVFHISQLVKVEKVKI